MSVATKLRRFEVTYGFDRFLIWAESRQSALAQARVKIIRAHARGVISDSLATVESFARVADIRHADRY